MATFEDYLEKTGWGLYNRFLLGIAAACAFSQATGLTSVPFATPLAGCDIQMSERSITDISVGLSFGMAFGGVLLSGASDVTGRKTMISTTLILIFGSNFASGFSHSYLMMLICAAVLGFGLTSNSNCVKIHLAEALPLKKRGFYTVFPDVFWTLGYLLLSAICWLMKPAILKNRSFNMRLTTWRLIYGFSAAPSIMVACATALLLPSPRYQLLNKKYHQALDGLKHIYAINNSRYSETLTIQHRSLKNLIGDFGMTTGPVPSNCTEYIVHVLKKIKSATVIIMSRRFIWLTIIMSSIRLAMLFGILMTNVWLSKMLHYGEKSDCVLTSGDVLHLEKQVEGSECAFDATQDTYRDFFFLATGILAGQVALMAVIERCGRRIPIICGCMICGISSISLAYIEDLYVARLVVSLVFMAFYSLTISALDVVTIESYPTAVRGCAAGDTQFFAHVAGGLLRKFFHTPCQYSFIFVGAIILGATALAYFLPDYTNRPMVE